jgi:sporulation protein YabP
MDKTIDALSLNHIITLNERKNINISGIKSITNFDSNEFLLDSSMGPILIKGANLEILKLDTIEGKVSIKGNIDAINYLELSEKSKNDSVFSKLFK